MNEEHVSTAAEGRWAAASVSRGVTRNVTRFRRHNYEREGSHSNGDTFHRAEGGRMGGGGGGTTPQNIHSSRQKYWPPPLRDACEHPVNSSRGNRVTRLDERSRVGEGEGEKKDDPNLLSPLAANFSR